MVWSPNCSSSLNKSPLKWWRCIVFIPDAPSAPQGPLEAIDTSPSAITLQWKPPLDDGGSRIQKYVLEKKPKGSNKWQRVPVNILPNETEATAKNLEEGQEYDFRVMAVNENGESAPLATTEPIKAKYPFGRLKTCE
jgi:Fibronectin type III domain